MKTVADLIKELQKLPPDFEVQVYGQGLAEGCPCIPELHVVEVRPSYLRHGGRTGGLVTVFGEESPA